jgi:hypothetical protein
MATLTYDPTPADQPEFNEAEQEALAIGEAAAAEQQQLLAGKFKDAEALEKAYLELQSKLGSKKNESSEEEQVAEPEEEVDEEDTSANILDVLWEEVQAGNLSDSTKEQLSKMNTADLAAEYLKYRKEVEENSTQDYDITDEQVADLRKIAGGDEGYQDMIAWASENLSKEEVQMYDNVIAGGNYDAITFAVHALKSRYTEAMGIEGQLFKGKPASSTKDVFRSQAEVVSAMADPRYDKDPAYRQDVFAKLERSNIQY